MMDGGKFGERTPACSCVTTTTLDPRDREGSASCFVAPQHNLKREPTDTSGGHP